MVLPRDDVLLIDITEGCAVVTVNRPHVRNAIGASVQAALQHAVAKLGSDPQIKTIVFTGAGRNAFVAGADVHGLRDYTAETALRSNLQRLFDEIEACEKPTIAAINGAALGGGCELAMACDIRVAAQDAFLGLPETGLGILPGAGGTQRLSRLVGVGHAMDMILTGRFVPAAEAQTMGLVSRVCAPQELLGAALEIASTVGARGPLAVRLAKTVIRAGNDSCQGTGLLLERLAQALLYDSADKTEGVKSFLEKRMPQFTGK
jgi:enoyl-CoA hydratase/carnithine racemase